MYAGVLPVRMFFLSCMCQEVDVPCPMYATYVPPSDASWLGESKRALPAQVQNCCALMSAGARMADDGEPYAGLDGFDESTWKALVCLTTSCFVKVKPMPGAAGAAGAIWRIPPCDLGQPSRQCWFLRSSRLVAKTS